MNEVLNVAKALGDANRLRALVALHAGELCVCQIVELLGLAPSTVSKHMSILRQASLVEARKEGRWIYYRPPRRTASKAVREALAWVQRNLNDTPTIIQDNKKLAKILRMDRETLCRQQNRS